MRNDIRRSSFRAILTGLEQDVVVIILYENLRDWMILAKYVLIHRAKLVRFTHKWAKSTIFLCEQSFLLKSTYMKVLTK